jgi:Asp-tRNA(Asn)/Glu-tRNA(Gln) amidotransferase C subunit
VTTISETAEDDEESRPDKPTDFGEVTSSPNTDSTETPVSESESQGKLEPQGDKLREDMDKTPSNVESAPASAPSAPHGEVEVPEASDELGSPGPSERNPEFEIIIQPTSVSA